MSHSAVVNATLLVEGMLIQLCRLSWSEVYCQKSGRDCLTNIDGKSGILQITIDDKSHSSDVRIIGVDVERCCIQLG